MSNNTPTAWTMFRCPFCGDDCLTTQQRTTQQGEVFFRVVCASCGSRGPNASDAVQAIASWNRRAQPSMSPHHPCDTLTARDEHLIGHALFDSQISITHVLPVHTLHELMSKDGGSEEVLDELEGYDSSELAAIFGPSASELTENFDTEILTELGGWIIMGMYPTMKNLRFNEQGKYIACTLVYGIQHNFLVWGRTYKQAVAKAIREQANYRRQEIAKAREAAGYDLA